jgi:hypothetical protein
MGVYPTANITCTLKFVASNQQPRLASSTRDTFVITGVSVDGFDPHNVCGLQAPTQIIKKLQLVQVVHIVRSSNLFYSTTIRIVTRPFDFGTYTLTACNNLGCSPSLIVDVKNDVS